MLYLPKLILAIDCTIGYVERHLVPRCEAPIADAAGLHTYQFFHVSHKQKITEVQTMVPKY